MLSDTDFDVWSERIGLSDRTRALIAEIRSQPPSRTPEGRRGNVPVRFPSQKMGCMLHVESRTVEYPVAFAAEDDDDVLEIYPQPPQIHLSYLGKKGQRLSHNHTPDLFLIHPDGAEWVECKWERELQDLAEKSPGRYHRDERGRWRCPPGEAYAARFGPNLSYRVCSSADINYFYHQNLINLADYMRDDRPPPAVADDVAAIVDELVRSRPGITIAELLDGDHGVDADDVNLLVLRRRIYVDRYAHLLTEPERVPLYPDEETARAYALMVEVPGDDLPPLPHIVDVDVGTEVTWDAIPWTIVNVGETEVTLVRESGKGMPISNEMFERLVKEGKIVGVAAQVHARMTSEAWERFLAADRKDKREANKRWARLRPFIDGELPYSDKYLSRNEWRWLRAFRMAERLWRIGYIGLLPQRSKMGNREPKMDPETREVLDDFILNVYETLKGMKRHAVYVRFRDKCKERGCPPITDRAFRDAVKRRPKAEQTEKREGSKAAYKYREWYWELDRTTPRHGDRAWEICHIDHTQLDVELKCSRTGRNLGKPWLTLLMDAKTRRVLAVIVTFDPPSYRSCMMVLRACVRRWGRLPQNIVVDGGPEFGSEYFDMLCAAFRITKWSRPFAQPHYGSVCERLFGTINTQFVHNLLGNTKVMKNVRQVTRAVNPKRHAVWTLARLYRRLLEYCHDVYDTADHTTLGQSPREEYARSLYQAGRRSHLLIPYDRDFLMWTMPTTDTGEALVQDDHRVKINYIWYTCDAFKHPEVVRTKVQVVYDPQDAGAAYAYVRGRWEECRSEHYAVFHGKSEREIDAATQELRRRYRNHAANRDASGTRLAEFLESLDAEELYLQQRMHDAAMRDVVAIIEDRWEGDEDAAARLTASVANLAVSTLPAVVAGSVAPGPMVVSHRPQAPISVSVPNIDITAIAPLEEYE
jgi:putative transposase